MTEEKLNLLIELLNRQIGHYRQLLETIRNEHEKLVQADRDGLQEALYSKEHIIHLIQQTEYERMDCFADSPQKTLTELILFVQGKDLAKAEQLRSIQNTLRVLAERAFNQNTDNKLLVEKSLEHIQAMKKNILGEITSKSQVYGQKGTKVSPGAGGGLISQEI